MGAGSSLFFSEKMIFHALELDSLAKKKENRNGLRFDQDSQNEYGICPLGQ